MKVRNIKLTIEYDGTNYHGWQRQQNACTVQEVVENSLGRLLGEKISLIGASRTDVGVHAQGQVANFYTTSRIPADKFPFALNNLLPDDISIKAGEEVDKSFHSRFSTRGKKYKYLIYNHPQPSAIYRNLVCHFPYRLNLEAMKEACEKYVGIHDFSAFMAAGSSVKTTVRTIYSCEIRKTGDLFEFSVSGNGFLYNMVRIMVGTVMDIGKGKLQPNEIDSILASQDRKRAGQTAPAQGLYLVEVYY